ncbi:hypothetical protein E2562_020311 [Oryza meyeriana var. granulata]|uniref:Uncharacterized protein n=1 Tax=Oryza meyeriana var. granulata TaxID=110450 RepID=A0A6G1EAT0_9ORYZ|nr:hypothetical protein E2562_020311 [Oryza meyeriana var. granulata]
MAAAAAARGSNRGRKGTARGRRRAAAAPPPAEGTGTGCTGKGTAAKDRDTLDLRGCRPPSPPGARGWVADSSGFLAFDPPRPATRSLSPWAPSGGDEA